MSNFSRMGLSSPILNRTALWINEYENIANIYAKCKLKFCVRTRKHKSGIGIYQQWQQYVMIKEISTLQKGILIIPKGTK